MAAVLAATWLVALDRSSSVEAWGYVLALGATLPVAYRRSLPLTAFAVSSACVLIALLAGPIPGTTAVAVAFIVYTIASQAPTHTSVIVMALAVALVLLSFVSTPGSDLQSLALDLLILFVVVVAAQANGVRRENIALLEERAQAIERDREQHAQKAVAGERARIARELHDIVAHSMSQISVQAGMGRMLSESQPRRATESLAAIEELSRGTLAEMRRLTGALRLTQGEGEAGLRPAHSMSDVEQLATSLRPAGIEVEVVWTGSVRALPQGIELAAYRIVQESLTNIVNHVGPSRARITLDYGRDHLTMSILDTGPQGMAPAGTRDPARSAGFGLLGMTERARGLGGQLVASPSGHGFLIEATLPLEDPS